MAPSGTALSSPLAANGIDPLVSWRALVSLMASSCGPIGG